MDPVRKASGTCNILTCRQMDEMESRLKSSSLYAGPKERLDMTEISQPAIYVASLAAVEKLRATEGDEARLNPLQDH